MAKDFSSKQPAPESRMSEARPAHDQGSFPDSCPECEAPKLGSESIANFDKGPGVAPSTRKIH